ncbi:GtrA family protein [Limnoglobus roseus]|uniref:Ribulose-phosphate 3-epimerase n=1 Tax=Limnoglobus roseus TaxID=2598579 RepID=A0A5C1ATU2_9BACT|nr:GtrA family protein [Limnoglobus roseus]QEL20188.1 ribulose-phosphate 3-epimerase [Limnoglobus roseus]
MSLLSRRRRRFKRLLTHTQLSYLIYRYRYLLAFTVIGFLSILLEVVLVQLMPADWPLLLRSGLAFGAGLLFSFVGNARFNFRVPHAQMLRAFGQFALVSGLSFGLNMLAVSRLQSLLGFGYPVVRLASAGVLFLIAYSLHRRYTFHMARNFGIAVYASSTERVHRILLKIGRNCDHVHVDLVDETMNRDAAPVDFSKVRTAKRLWPDIPVCLHLMSRQPAKWMPEAWDLVDWVLFHADSEDDLNELFLECRRRGKKVGIVWHVSVTPGQLLQYLPHVDFVMVLGIRFPGRSGQQLLPEAVEVANVFDALRPRYGYEVMFDGGVSAETIARIPAKYIVAASAVLKASDPVRISHTLRTGARYERRAA